MEHVEITHYTTGRGGEYRARVGGSPYIGRLTYAVRDHGKVRIAEHTIVPPQIAGRGIAARLVAALVADAQGEGFKVAPQCSYVEAAFRRNPGWTALRA